MRLLETQQKFATDSEEAAKEAIEAFRTEAKQKGYTIKKAGYEYRAKKAKGEVIGEQWMVTIVQIFSGLWEELDG